MAEEYRELKFELQILQSDDGEIGSDIEVNIMQGDQSQKYEQFSEIEI